MLHHATVQVDLLEIHWCYVHLENLQLRKSNMNVTQMLTVPQEEHVWIRNVATLATKYLLVMPQLFALLLTQFHSEQ